MTLSPNPELLQAGKQSWMLWTSPFFFFFAPLVFFFFPFSLSSHFSFFFLIFPFIFFLLFSSFLLSFPSFHNFPIFFSFHLSFLSFIAVSDQMWNCQFWAGRKSSWSKAHHLCFNIWYLGPISKISRLSRSLPLNGAPSVWDYQPCSSHKVWAPGFASSAHSEDTSNYSVLHRLEEEWK